MSNKVILPYRFLSSVLISNFPRSLNSSTYLHAFKHNKNTHSIAELNIKSNLRIKPRENSKFVINEASSTERLDDAISDVSDETFNRFGTLSHPLEDENISQNADVNAKESSQTYRRKVSNKANVFGDISKDEHYIASLPDFEREFEPSDESTLELPFEKEYKNAQQYLKKMRELVSQKKLKEALELFPHMKRNNIWPEHVNYTFMISACGKAGYTEMAFKLFRQMTDRGYRPTSATLTGLFNSCAECPFPDYGLKKATALREKIVMKNYPVNKPSYHAMIKAFGKCGDIETAFQIVDEMIKEKVPVDAETYNFLLMSCISNKDAGFTHAVQVWRKMLSKTHQPNTFTFNLMLRATRECDVGPEEISCLLLEHWSSYRRRPYGFNNEKKMLQKDEFLKLPDSAYLAIEAKKQTTVSNNDKTLCGDVSSKTVDSSGNESEKFNQSDKTQNFSVHNAIIDYKQQTPAVNTTLHSNILAERPVSGPEYIQILDIKTPSDRLALFGGAEGFLQLMKKYKVNPDIKTFTLLLECLPASSEAENALLNLLDVHKVKPDIDFFNILIKKRNLRNDYISAKNVLSLVNKYNLRPDIVTFGVLSLGCRKRSLGVRLLNNMRQLGVSPNVEIMGGLIYNACRSADFAYLCDVLQIMKSLSIAPNDRILSKLEEFIETCRKDILEKERNQEVASVVASSKFLLDYHNFCDFYANWLKSMNVELESHPWDQYKVDIIERPTRIEIPVPIEE